MFKNLSQSIRKNSVTFITLGIVIMVLYGYFKIYVPGNQSVIDARNFRVLARLNMNINSQQEAFFKNRDVFLAKLHDKFSSGLNSVLFNYDSVCYKKSSQKFYSLYSGSFGKDDSDCKHISVLEYVDSLKKYVSIEERRLKGNLRLDYSIYDYYSNPELIVNLYDGKDEERKNLKPKTEEGKTGEGKKLLDDLLGYYYVAGDDIKHDTVYSVNLSLNWKDLMHNLERKDFKYYLIIKNGELIYSSNDQSGIDIPLLKDQIKDKISEKLSFSIKNPKQFDSLMAYSFIPFNTSNIKDITISGQDYKLYLLPVNSYNNEQLVLCGLVSASAYEKESRSIPEKRGMLITFLILLFVLSIPFIKLLMMSPVERLGTWDLIYSMISVILFVLFSTTFLLFSREETRHSETYMQPQLLYIDSTIGNTFYQRVRSACLLLTRGDSIASKYYESNENLLINKDSINILNQLLSTNDSTSGKLNFQLPELQKNTAAYNSFIHIYWLDRNADQLFTWTLKKWDTVSVNVSDRDYFKVIENDLLNQQFRIPESDSENYFISPVFSWTSGQFRTIISTKSRHYKTIDDSFPSMKSAIRQREIACITLKNTGIENSLIPPGYGFAIINAKGDIYYCSDSSRNLNENLIEECDEGDKIISAIHSRTNEYFTGKYHGNRNNFFISPIQSMPLFVVSWHNLSVASSLMSKCFSFTLSCMGVIFLFLMLFIFIVIAVRKPEHGKNIFDFNIIWLWPVKYRMNNYRETLWYNFMIIVVITIFNIAIFKINSFTENLTAYVIYTDLTGIIALVFNTYFQYMYEGKQSMVRKHWDTLLLIPAIIFLILFFTGFTFQLAFYYLPLLLIGLLIIFYSFKPPAIQKAVVNLFKDPLPVACWIFVTWIFITTIIPSIGFLKISFDREKLIQLKNYQIGLAEKFKFNKINLDKSAAVFDQDSISVNSTPALNPSLIDDDKIYDFIMHGVSTYSDSAMINERNLSKQKSDEQNIATHQWELKKRRLIYYDQGIAPSQKIMKKTIVVSSPFHAFDVFKGNPFEIIFFLLSGGLLIIILYLFIKFIVSKYFGIVVPKIDESHKYFTKILLDDRNHRQLFLNGLPGCGKFQFVESILTFSGRKFFILNTIDLPDNIGKLTEIDGTKLIKLFKLDNYKYTTSPIVIIRHFEYNFKNEVTNRLKLNLLEQLIADNKKIIILSDVHPVSFLQSNAEFDLLASADEKKNMREDIERWSSLLGNFINYYYHKTSQPVKDMPADDMQERNRNLIKRECRMGIYMENIKVKLLADSELIQLGSSSKILNEIKIIAQLYYHNIWTSLTKQEQYLVYDLAQDGLMNTKNYSLIKQLHMKGLLINDQPSNKMTLFNKSFTNFIKTEIDPKEVLVIEKGIKEEGRWNNFRTPFLIVIGALVVFIASTQQQSFNSVFTYVSIFVTAATVFQKLIGVFDFGGAKPSK